VGVILVYLSAARSRTASVLRLIASDFALLLSLHPFTLQQSDPIDERLVHNEFFVHRAVLLRDYSGFLLHLDELQSRIRTDALFMICSISRYCYILWCIVRHACGPTHKGHEDLS